MERLRQNKARKKWKEAEKVATSRALACTHGSAPLTLLVSCPSHTPLVALCARPRVDAFALPSSYLLVALACTLLCSVPLTMLCPSSRRRGNKIPSS